MDSFQKTIETPIFYLVKLKIFLKTNFQASGLIYDPGLLWKKCPSI
jgi:hypothetical protein